MRRGLSILAGLVGLLGLAAWLVPPNLDASRYRDTLEEIASEALGGRARIQGKLAFTLLPLPRLIATNVILGDDNTTALRTEELRLRVSPWRLLAGHFAAHDLVLRGAELRLPWPPYQGGTHLVPTQWATPFPTRVERARLILGALELRDIAADIRATDTGFEMQGTARAGAHDLRLMARLGVPDNTGAALFEISAEGSARQSSAGLRIHGQVTPQGDATAQVSLHASDLSQLLPTPAIALRAGGPLSLTAHGLRAEDWSLTLPSGAARAAATLTWEPAALLELRFAAPRLDLEPWLPAIATARVFRLPITLDLAVEAAGMGGRDLRQLRGRLGWSEGGIALYSGTAILPGEAALSLDGNIPAGAGSAWFVGNARIVADDPRASMGWMEGWLGLPLSAANLPLYGTDVRTRVELGPGALALSEMQGRVAETNIRGALSLRQDGQRTIVMTDLELDQVRIDAWAGDAATILPALGRAVANLGGDVQAHVAELRLGGQMVENIVLDAGMVEGRLALRRLAGNTLGARFDVSGGLTVDGRIADGRVEVNMPNATPVRNLLPTGWQAAPALWNAPLSLRADVSGTMEALATHLQAELGDLRLDTQQTIDFPARRGGFRLSAHHPGAGRLLSALGVADPAAPGSLRAWAPDWPGEGSFSLQAQGAWKDQALTLGEFQLTAGGLRGSGRLTFDATGEAQAINGQFHAESLPLPWPPASADTPLPQRPSPATRVDLRLSADQVLDGDSTLARQAVCGLFIARGETSLKSCTMQIAGGQGSLDATLSDTVAPPRLTVRFSLDDTRIGPMEPRPPFAVSDGTLAASLSFAAQGHSLAALRNTAEGTLQMNLRGPVLNGLDLAGINAALTGIAGRPTDATVEMLRNALLEGATPFDKLTVAGQLEHGVLRLRDGSASSAAGSIDFGGDINLAAATVDATVQVRPSAAPETDLEVRLSGPVDAPTRMPELLRALRWLANRMN